MVELFKKISIFEKKIGHGFQIDIVAQLTYFQIVLWQKINLTKEISEPANQFF